MGARSICKTFRKHDLQSFIFTMKPEGWGSVFSSVEVQPPGEQDFNPVFRKEAVTGTDPCRFSTMCSLSCWAQHEDQSQGGLRRAKEGPIITWNPVTTDCMRQLIWRLWQIKGSVSSSPDPFHWLRASSHQALHKHSYYIEEITRCCPFVLWLPTTYFS